MNSIPEQVPAQERLRVHVPTSISRLLIAPALPRLIHQHPGLRVQVAEANAAGRLPNGADAAVCIGWIADPSLVVQRIGTVHAVTCAAPDFLHLHGVPASPADLDPARCIGLVDRASGRAQEWTFHKGRERYSLLPAAPIAFCDADAAIEAAVRGGGFVRALSVGAEQKIAAGLLEPVLAGWSAGSWPVSFVHTRSRIVNREVLVFGAFLETLFPMVQSRVQYLDERASIATGRQRLGESSTGARYFHGAQGCRQPERPTFRN